MEEGKKLRLLCIPPSATSAMMYLKWQEHFPENIEIVPIELPGKGTKFREKMADSIDEMTDRIIDEIKEKAGNENYALFGFCSGSVIAFDLMQKLMKQGFREPEYFIAASSRDPADQISTPSALDISDESLKKMFMNIFQFKVDADNNKNMCEFIGLLHPESTKELENMNDDEFLKAIDEDTEEGRKAVAALRRSLEVFRKDSAMLHSYIVPKDIRKFNMPVTMIHGKYDALVKRSEVNKWKNYCNNSFDVKMINGGHLAVFDNYEGAIEAIKETIL